MKNSSRKILSYILALTLVLSYAVISATPMQVYAATDASSFKTSLKTFTTTSDQYVFDVWAKDEKGVTIPYSNITVKHNDKTITASSQNTVRGNYLLTLAMGDNVVTITVGEKTYSYTITKTAFPEDGINGEYIFSVEASVVGLGFIVEPTRNPINMEKYVYNTATISKNAAHNLTSYFSAVGITQTKGGNENYRFLLSTIKKTTGSIYDTPISIPQEITNLNLGLTTTHNATTLGNNDFKTGSKWSFKINSEKSGGYLNEYYLQDGDVLSYSFDVGVPDTAFPTVDKSEVTRQLAYINSAGNYKKTFLDNTAVKTAYDKEKMLLLKIGVTQTELDEAQDEMTAAISDLVAPLITAIVSIAKIQTSDLESLKPQIELIENLTKKEKQAVNNIASYENAKIQYEYVKDTKAVNDITAEFSKVLNIKDVTIKAQYDQAIQARKLYDTLPQEYKQQVVAYENFVVIEDVVLKAKADVDTLEAEITALPTLKQLILQDQVKVEAAVKKYAALTDDQKTYITSESKTKLDTLKEAVDVLVDKDTIDTTNKMIDALPTIGTVVLEDAIRIENVRKQIERLTASQLAQIATIDKVAMLEEMIDRLALDNSLSEIKYVNQLIINLPSLSLVDIKDKEQLEKVTLYYNELDETQRQKIIGFSIVETLNQKINTLSKTALALVDQIAALPTKGNIQLTNRDAIENIRIQYSDLTLGQKEIISNYAHLEESEKDLAQLQTLTVMNVMLSIIELPDAAAISIDDQLTVLKIRSKYDQLTTQQQDYISNYSKLVAAEAQLALLTQKNDANAQKIEKSIAAIPETKLLKLSNENQIVSVRQVFDRSSNEVQSLVSNYERLVLSEEKMQQLVSEEEKIAFKVNLAISVLPTATKIKITDETAINSTRKAYDQLTTVQKKYITNYSKLTSVETALKKLQASIVVTTKTAKMSVPAIKNTTKTIKGTANKYTTVYVYKGSKILKKAKVNTTGNYSMTIPSQKKGTTLKIVLKNSEGNTVKTTKVIVAAAKVAVPSTIKATVTKITGKATKSSKIIIYKKNKKIATTTTNSKGDFSVKYTKQQKGNQLIVYAFDFAGNKSKKKTVYVK